MLFNHGFDQRGAVVPLQGGLQCFANVGAPLHPEALDAVGGGEFDEVGISIEIHAGKAIFIEEVLPLANHTEIAVVHHQDLMGSLLTAAVASSHRVIWKDPSPTTV